MSRSPKPARPYAWMTARRSLTIRTFRLHPLHRPQRARLPLRTLLGRRQTSRVKLMPNLRRIVELWTRLGVILAQIVLLMLKVIMAMSLTLALAMALAMAMAMA
eukprot:Rmarinus@m.13846